MIPRLPRLTILRATLALAAGLPPGAAQNDGGDRTAVLQAAGRQAEVAADALVTSAAVRALAEEILRNDIASDQLETLLAIATRLEQLGGVEMNQLAARLREAARASGAAFTQALDQGRAKAGAVEQDLERLSQTLAVRNLRQALDRALDRIIAHQTAALRATEKGARSSDTYAPRQTASAQQIVSDELRAWLASGDAFLERLRETPATPGQDGTTFATRVNGDALLTVSGEATQHLLAARWREARDLQLALLERLKTLRQSLSATRAKTDRLRDTLAALDQARQNLADSADSPEAERQAAEDQARAISSAVAPLAPQEAAALADATPEQLTPSLDAARQKLASELSVALAAQEAAAQAATAAQAAAAQAAAAPPAEQAAAATRAEAAARDALAAAQDAASETRAQLATAASELAAAATQARADNPDRAADLATAAAERLASAALALGLGEPTLASVSDGKGTDTEPTGAAGGHLPGAEGGYEGPVSSTTRLSPAQREALAPVPQEPVHPDYRDRVQAYWRALARQP